MFIKRLSLVVVVRVLETFMFLWGLVILMTLWSNLYHFGFLPKFLMSFCLLILILSFIYSIKRPTYIKTPFLLLVAGVLSFLLFKYVEMSFGFSVVF